MSFRPSIILNEVISNALASRIATAVSMTLVAVITFAVIGASVMETRAIEDRLLDYQIRGGYVAVITDKGHQPLSGSRCEQLRTVSGVVAAGGIVSQGNVTVDYAPTASIVRTIGTPGLAEVYWPGLSVSNQLPSTVVGGSLAERLGLTPGVVWQYNSSERAVEFSTVGRVGLGSARDPLMDTGVYESASPSSDVINCMVESDPGAVSAVGAVISGWFNDEIVVSDWLQSEKPPNSARPLSTRISLWLPLVASLVFLAFFAISTTSKRAEYAIYRVLGLGDRGLALLILGEWAALALLPSAVGLTVGLVVFHSSLTGMTLEATTGDQLRLLLGMALSPAAMFVVARARSTIEYLKGR